MNVILIEDLKLFLNRISIRAIRNWCLKNDVLIMHKGTKAECVSEMEFEMAFNKPLIDKLKKKFGKGWESVYKLHKSGSIEALAELNNAATTSKYFISPKNKNKILSELQDKFYNYAKTS
jgi:hypothetical protein